MNALLAGLSSEFWTSLVFALLHSLWLGAVWIVLLSLGLRLAGRDSSRRYFVSLLALAGLVLSTVTAWAILSGETGGMPPVMELPASESIAPKTIPAAEEPIAATAARDIEHKSTQWPALLAGIWLTGCLVMIGRLIIQLAGASRIRRQAAIVTDSRWTSALAELKQRIGLTRLVKIAESVQIEVPSVFGLFAPVILFPASLLTGVSPEQFRAIAAHELAHIRRHDYLANIIQQIFEALLFFNPAVWWINRQIRIEREACCDALAVAATASAETYARALADTAEHASGVFGRLQPAFPGEGRSSLLDRVRRLIFPEYRPLVKLPWTSLAGILLLSSLMLFAMWRGSRFAVAIAAEILSPAQRIEKIAELHAEHYPAKRLDGSDEKVRIAGVVRTWDGAPLPAGAQINLHIANESHTYFSGARLKQGRFDEQVNYGMISMAVYAPGYGPAFLPPMAPNSTNLNRLEIVLPEGFPGRIQFVNAQNQPLAGVQVEARYAHPAGFIPLKTESDARGEVVLTNSVDAPLKFQALRAGFQYDAREDVHLAPEKAFVWKLQPAQPASGTVVHRRTKEPVAGAEIRLLRRASRFPTESSRISDAQKLAVTGRDGAFQLDTLIDGATHMLAIAAPGFAPEFVRNVMAGQHGIRVELGPELSIQGEIRGDLALLEKAPGPVIAVGNPIKIGDSQSVHLRHVPVEITNGAGYFTISNLHEGEVEITAGPVTKKLELDAPLRDVVIDLTGRQAQPVETRTVLIEFDTPPGAPPVRGALTGSISADGHGSRMAIPVINNQARIEVPVNAWLHWEARDLIGYWVQSDSLRVQAGDEPRELSLRAIPAGAIHGKVLNQDGSPASGVLISVVEIRPGKSEPGGLSDLGKRSASENDGLTGFIVQPLPLGGEYTLIARRSGEICASEKITLTEATPIVEANLQFIAGKEATALVTDEAGKPLPGIPVEIQYNHPHNTSFGFEPILSDAKGRVQFARVNPNLPGQYEWMVFNARGFQPVRTEINLQEQPTRLVLKPGLKVSGRVVDDETGQPLRNIELYAMTAEYIHGQKHPAFINTDAKTDAEGRFVFSQLTDRDYVIGCRDGTIMNSNSLNRPNTIVVTPSDPEPVVVRIKANETD